MLLSTIATAALLASAAPPPHTAGDHGKLPWFEGSYEELMAEAQAKDKLVFLDFWTSW